MATFEEYYNHVMGGKNGTLSPIEILFKAVVMIHSSGGSMQSLPDYHAIYEAFMTLAGSNHVDSYLRACSNDPVSAPHELLMRCIMIMTKGRRALGILEVCELVKVYGMISSESTKSPTVVKSMEEID
jgi:hypothetical protein